MDISSYRQPLRRIGILPVQGFALMSYSSTVEPLRAANLLAGTELYDLVHVSLDGVPVKSSGAAWVGADAVVGDALDLDLLLVVAGGGVEQLENPVLFDWLGRVARRGTVIGGVSGAPVLLVKAGLMKGRRMTVHWEHASPLSEIDPDLRLERTLYVIDRDRVTCAGGTAPMDLIHALIARDHGRIFARLVSDWFLHTEVRPAGGAQRGGLAERLGTTSPPLLDAVGAMETHVSDPLALSDLAMIAGVSERQLNRLFSEKLGRTTMQYYRDLRLDVALGLLRNSPLSLTEIAYATGFANSSHFSRTFSARHGHAPRLLRTAEAI